MASVRLFNPLSHREKEEVSSVRFFNPLSLREKEWLRDYPINSLSLRETTAWTQELERRRKPKPRAGVREPYISPHPHLLPKGEGIALSHLANRSPSGRSNDFETIPLTPFPSGRSNDFETIPLTPFPSRRRKKCLRSVSLTPFPSGRSNDFETIPSIPFPSRRRKKWLRDYPINPLSRREKEEVSSVRLFTPLSLRERVGVRGS